MTKDARSTRRDLVIHEMPDHVCARRGQRRLGSRSEERTADAMRVTPRSSRLRPITASLLVVLPLVIVIPGPTGSSASSAAARLQHSTPTASPPRSRQFAHSFVIRSGPRLYVAGRPFRFGGANIEWLGLAGYGPFEPNGPHFPSDYEIDDAMATAREMGVTVVRSQTMADSV